MKDGWINEFDFNKKEKKRRIIGMNKINYLRNI